MVGKCWLKEKIIAQYVICEQLRINEFFRAIRVIDLKHHQIFIPDLNSRNSKTECVDEKGKIAKVFRPVLFLCFFSSLRGIFFCVNIRRMNFLRMMFTLFWQMQTFFKKSFHSLQNIYVQTGWCWKTLLYH